MIKIQIESQSVTDAFNRLLQAGDDMTPIMDAIGLTMENRTRERFETKTDPTGASWESWKPSTIKSYPKDGNKRLLNRFNDMLGSLNYQTESHSVFIGFGQSYAEYHEFGTSKMVRRGMLTADPVAGTLGAGDEQAIMDVLRGALQNAIDG